MSGDQHRQEPSGWCACCDAEDVPVHIWVTHAAGRIYGGPEISVCDDCWSCGYTQGDDKHNRSIATLVLAMRQWFGPSSENGPTKRVVTATERILNRPPKDDE